MDNGQYVSPSGRTISWWFVLLFKAYSWFNPLALFRLGGRYTLGLIRRRRQDICQPFNILWEKEEDNVSADYLHQANLHTPTYVIKIKEKLVRSKSKTVLLNIDSR